MKRFVALMLVLLMLLVSCDAAGGKEEGTTLPDGGEETTTTPEEESSDETPEEPVNPDDFKIRIPKPYIDIQFTESGEFYDRMDRVVCSLEDPEKGNVVNSEVRHNGEGYTVPHYSVTGAGGVMRMSYRDLNDSASLYQELYRGFAMEAFLVNHVALGATDAEHAMIASCQAGGYNLTTYLGKYTFSVHTGGSYSNATLDGPYNTEELTHLVAVYDPDLEVAKLYVNGSLVSTVEASGTFKLGNSNAYRVIIMGGDTGADGVQTTTYASSLEVVDFKMYDSILTDMQCRALYTVATGELAGDESWKEVIKTDVDLKPQYEKEEDSFVQSLYEAETALQNPPTVWEMGDEDLPALSFAEQAPNTVLMSVSLQGNELYAKTESGAVLGYLRQALKAMEGVAMPALRVEDQAAADALAEFLRTNGMSDCFVVSTDAKLLREIGLNGCHARLVLDRRSVQTIDPARLFLDAANAGSKTVLLPAPLLDAANVIALRAHSLSVVAALDANPTAAQIHNAIFAGVSGILGDACEPIYDYYKTITERTLALSPLLVAHRGDSNAFPDNSMRAILSAAASGADAIEIDVRLTADGEVVLNHDAKATRFSEELQISSSTRAQLEALTYVGTDGNAEDKLVFLDELLETMKTLDPNVVFTIELKAASVALIDEIVRLVKLFEMEDRVLLTGMDALVATYTWEQYGLGAQLNLSNFVTAQNASTSLVLACMESARLHSSCFSKIADETPGFIRGIHHRLIKYSTWTLTSVEATQKHHFTGVPEYTTDEPHALDEIFRYLRATVAADGKIGVVGVCYDGTEVDVTDRVTLVVLSGNVTLSDGKVSGNGSFAFRLETSLPQESSAFCLYSAALSIG